MNLPSQHQRHPKTLLGLFISGSLIVLLLCVFGAAFVFSLTFLKKEEQRSLIFTEQLTHSFEFQYRLITEEMWTQNYEAIDYRIDGIAKQFGHAKYDLILADDKGKCVFASGVITQNPTPCEIPELLKIEIAESTAHPGSVIAGVRYDTATQRYVYSVPLFVGAVRKGHLYATVTDPYGFFRGNVFLLTLRMFLPAIFCVFLVWMVWLLMSRRFILRPYLSSLVELEKKEALGKLAAQVAHDIQSPLAVLTSVVMNSHGLSSDQNLLLKSASSRIHSLADDLLAKYKDPKSNTELQFTLVSATVSSIISEKYGMLGKDPTVELKSEIAPDALVIGIPLSSSTLLRILSNLLNNAIEATQEKMHSKITVRVNRHQSNVIIAIEDTGTGISPEVLQKIRTVGGTYGKTNGAGIGIQFAREVVIAAGGRFSIDSLLNHGTTVTLEIPSAPTPAWCATHLELGPSDKILVLDDDESVHLLWQQRLAGRNVTYIKDPEEFDPRMFPHSEYRFIFDYEITGSAVTGLDLITSHRLGERAVLVTSYFNDPKIQQAVARVGSRILPKFIMSCAEIKSCETEGALEVNSEPDLVLIDDEPVNHIHWRVQAKRSGKNLLSVTTENDLDRHDISKTTPIFVDNRLGNGVSGYKVAERLFSRGFHNLYLTTGDNAELLPSSPYFQRIIGKDFPANIL